MMNIGPSLKRVREHKNWRQGKVAEKAGISQTHLSKIERGEIDTPHLSTITDVLEALGVNSERLIKRVLKEIQPDEFMDLCREDSQFQ